jgi:hypothetical protein
VPGIDTAATRRGGHRIADALLADQAALVFAGLLFGGCDLGGVDEPAAAQVAGPRARTVVGAAQDEALAEP